MFDSNNSEAESRDAFEQLAEEFLIQHREGARPSIEAFADQHPQHADKLRELLPTLLVLEGMAPQATDNNAEFAQPKILGDFKIIREVGRGGMGIVYEAEQLSLKRLVALKVLPFASLLGENQLRRFRNEAHAAATLKHRNIVGVHAVGCERGVHYYAMEFVQGSSLATVIDQVSQDVASDTRAEHRHEDETKNSSTQSGSSLSSKRRSDHRQFVRAVAELGVQAAEALEHAHSLGIVHRDIKPSNLILDQEGKLWITDFGLAYVESAENLTATGDVLGTLRYMSPEQASGQRVLDARTDIFSLGVTLYELLTLKPAFGGTDKKKLLTQVRHTEPVSPRKIDRQLPNDIERIIQKAIAHEPQDRYRSAAAFAEDLTRFLTGHNPLARKPTLQSRVMKWASRNPMAIATTMLVLVAVTAAALVSNSLLVRETQRAENAKQAALTAEAMARSEAENAKRSAKNAEAINRFLTDYVLINADPSQSTGRSNTTFRQGLDNAAEYAEKWYPDDPQLRASLFKTIAKMYARLGESEQSITHFQKALSLYKDLDGPTSDALECENELGLELLRLGRLDSAEELLQSNLQQSRSTLGPEDNTTLQAMQNLANVRLDQKRYKEAESIIRQCYDIRRRLGTNDCQTATAAITLGRVLMGSDRVAEAEAMIADALTCLQEQLGPQDLRTQVGMEALATIYRNRGDLELAEDLYQQIFQHRLRVQGKEHSLTMLAMKELARLLEMQNHLPEAEALIRQLMQVHQLTSGDNLELAFAAEGDLARLLWLQGKLTEAAAIFKSDDIVDLLKNDEAFDVALNYADILLGSGQYTDAAKLLQTTWKRAEQELGENHPVCGSCFTRLLFALFAERKTIEANDFAVKNMRLFGPIMNSPDAWVAEVLGLKYMLDRTANPWTESLLQNSLAAKLETLPETHLSIALTQAVLAQDLLAKGKSEQAEPLLRKCLAIREAALPSGNRLLAETRSLLGHCLAQLGRYEKAESLLLDSFNAIQNEPMVSTAVKLDFLERLIDLYAKLKDVDQLRTLRPQLASLLQECLRNWKKITKPADKFVTAAEARYGECLIDLGRFEEAERVLLELCASIVTNAQWHADPYSSVVQFWTVSKSRQHLIRLYDRSDNPEERERWKLLVNSCPGKNEFASIDCHQQGVLVWETICGKMTNPLFQIRLARAYLDQADASLRLDRPEQAITEYRKSLSRIQSTLSAHPDNLLAKESLVITRLSLADALLEMKKYGDAGKNLELATTQAQLLPEHDSPNTASISTSARLARNELAWFLAACPDPNFRNPARAIEISQRNGKGEKDLALITAEGMAHYRLGDMRSAIATLNRLVPGTPGWCILAMAHHAGGDEKAAKFHYETAVARFQNVLVIKQDNQSLSDWFAFRRYKNLFVLASEKMGLSPDEHGSIEAHWKGMALLERGLAQLACESFKLAISLDSGYPAPYLGLARGLAAIEPIDELAAFEAIEQYFDLNPQDVSGLAYVIRGSLLGRQGQLDQSITSLKKAIVLENDSGVLAGWAYSDLADTYKEIGNHSAATKSYQRALVLLPGEADPRSNFSRFLALCSDLRVRDPEKSIQLAREAVELQSDEAEHWTTLCIALFRNGELKEAEQAAHKATELSNGGTAADFLVLAMVNWRIGAQKLAHEFHEKARHAKKELPPDTLLTQLREEANELISKDSTLAK